MWIMVKMSEENGTDFCCIDHRQKMNFKLLKTGSDAFFVVCGLRDVFPRGLRQKKERPIGLPADGRTVT